MRFGAAVAAVAAAAVVAVAAVAVTVGTGVAVHVLVASHQQVLPTLFGMFVEMGTLHSVLVPVRQPATETIAMA